MWTMSHQLVRPGAWLAAAVLVPVVLIAAGPPTGRAAASSRRAVLAAAAGRCAATAPPLAGPGPSASSLVPVGPATATVCDYPVGIGQKKAAGLVRSFVLRGPAAAGLAAVLDSAGPVTAAVRSCDRPARLLPFAQQIVFGYRAAPSRTAVVAQTDCDLAVVTAGSRSGVLASQTADDLFGYTGLRSTTAAPRTPDLIGLTAQAATSAAGHDHFSVSVDAVVTDPGARFGTVIFQVPPAGLTDAGPGTQVGLILAVHRARPCAAGQLTARYSGGGASAGNDFGTLLISDTAGRPCALAGRLLVTGLGAAGQVVTASVRFPVTGSAVLSPAGQPDALVGQLMLGAEYRDDAATASGLCEPLWVVPAHWRVILPGGQSLSAANADPANPSKLVPSGGFVTCRGEFGAAQAVTVGVGQAVATGPSSTPASSP